MTNNGIKTGLILDALYEAKADDWRAERNDDDYARITYAEFTRILRKNEIVIDPRTVKIKWELLTDIGIFATANKVSAVVDLIRYECYNAKYKLTGPAHTYIQKPETTTEASE
jgi:hypothetical protein